MSWHFIARLQDSVSKRASSTKRAAPDGPPGRGQTCTADGEGPFFAEVPYSIETATCCYFENGALTFDTPATFRSKRPIKRAQKQSKRICVTKVVSDFHLCAGSARLQMLRQSVKPLQLA